MEINSVKFSYLSFNMYNIYSKWACSWNFINLYFKICLKLNTLYVSLLRYKIYEYCNL
jgi:hypothetical protein